MRLNSHTHKGFVSIFVVIFSAILISIITISFVRLMINDQQQATSNDLSRSAYDSALAGAEDAKRLLINCNSDPTSDACKNINNNYLKCIDALGVASDAETSIETNNSESLNQAYTCVKIQMNTDNYLGSLSQDGYKMIPLSATGVFDTIQLEWFSANNATSTTVNFMSSDESTPLFAPTKPNTPPLLRAQFIQFATTAGFNLSDLDNGVSASSQTGSSTLFLYPSETGLTSTSFPSTRLTPQTSPKGIICKDLDLNVYSCSVKITHMPPIISTDQSAFLILSAFYNNADYKVTLLNSAAAKPANPVPFNGVQPEIDSTGRANDLFRRVKTRVELTDANFPYPEAAVDITGNLCKTFSVTDKANDYVAGGCTD